MNSSLAPTRAYGSTARKAISGPPPRDAEGLQRPEVATVFALLSEPSPQAPDGVGCRWCGSSLDGCAETLGGRLRCNHCGVASTYPFPTSDELDAAYATWYRPESGRFSGVGDLVLRRTRGLLARRLDEIAPPGPVLDVGSGDGSLLDALSARGRTAVGLERESNRPDVRDVPLREIGGQWAAIVFWHSLEHLGDPREELALAAARLAPGGVLVVAVPNAGSLQARVFGDDWLALDMPRHLVHIPAAALINQLEALSVRAERVSYWRGGQVVFGWLHGLVKKLPGRPDLYDAIRRPEAQQQPLTPRNRAVALASGVVLTPVAALASAIEIAARRGGTVYVEGRRV